MLRFIKNLAPETIRLLQRLYKYSRYHQVSQRAHCILLSFEGYTVSELMVIFNVSRVTIYNWFNAWESQHFAGLYDKKGRGRKPSFTDEQKEKIRKWAKEFPKNLVKVCVLVKEEFSIIVCKETIKRVLKSQDFTWRRVRRKEKGKPDPKVYAQKKQELEDLKGQDEQGEIDLRYFDESGFCLEPYIPYAWQEKGETIEIETSKSKRLNILGFMNRNHDLEAYCVEGTVNSQVVIACIDDFCKGIKKNCLSH